MFRAFAPGRGGELVTKFHAATSQDVDNACTQAAAAFAANCAVEPRTIALLLEGIAANIVALGNSLVSVACEETGLPEARIAGERDRTCNQLRMFAGMVREGSWVNAIIDHGDAARKPLPRPDLRRMLRPLGPVAVFGASNFPLAYSTAGGDTASALAARCPVIVKGHPSHPGTGELVAHAVRDAVDNAGLHAGTFSFLHAGGEREMAVGSELLMHPAVAAVGFTGSFKGGMALHRLAQERATPIPVFAEMGSTNPVFVMPGSLATRAAEIAEKLVGSATASVGQMCTCPGLIFVVSGKAAKALISDLSTRLTGVAAQAMLSPRVASGFSSRVSEASRAGGVGLLVGGTGHDGRVTPSLLRVTLADFLRSPTLAEEIFGPAAIVVECPDAASLLGAARAVHGSLTATIWSEPGEDGAVVLFQQLVERAGRVIHNGVPTGVEVAAAMVHGGPFPATNQPQSSAVGTLAIERWCRPVCYQNVPDALLPVELKEANPLGISRLVDGRRV